jgi:hypothetical protein
VTVADGRENVSILCWRRIRPGSSVDQRSAYQWPCQRMAKAVAMVLARETGTRSFQPKAMS